MFMEQNRLFAHRSWTGFGIYEATFARVEGGHVGDGRGQGGCRFDLCRETRLDRAAVAVDGGDRNGRGPFGPGRNRKIGSRRRTPTRWPRSRLTNSP